MTQSTSLHKYGNKKASSRWKYGAYSIPCKRAATETPRSADTSMELDSTKMYEAIVKSTTDNDLKLQCEMSQIQNSIEKEQTELQWIESSSRLANFLASRGVNSLLLLSALKEGNLPKEKLVVDRQNDWF